jgi:type II secretory pathway component HofQ
MVLRTLADISGKNVLIDPSLSGRTVTANLDNIPYDQALEIIMGQVNAGMRGAQRHHSLRRSGRPAEAGSGTTRDEAARASDVAPLVAENIQAQLRQDRRHHRPGEQQLRSGCNSDGRGASGCRRGSPRQPISPGGFACAGTGPRAVRAPAGGGSSAKGMLSARGSISAHDATNQLFVRDTAAVVEAIREVIRNVDVPPKQVMIEARIVEASTGFASSLGMRLRLANANLLGNQGGQNLFGTGTRWAPGTTTSYSNTDTYGVPSTPTLTRSTDIFKPSYAPGGSGQLWPDAVQQRRQQAARAGVAGRLKTDSRNKTISSPRIVTLNRKAATINNTQQVTILSGVNATTGLPIYQTFSAPLTLGVTPSVNPDNRISPRPQHRQEHDHQRDDRQPGYQHGNHQRHCRKRGNGGHRRFRAGIGIAGAGPRSLPRRPALRGESFQNHDKEQCAQRAAGFHYAAHHQRRGLAAIARARFARTRGRLVCRPPRFLRPPWRVGTLSRGRGISTRGPRERISWRNRPATEVQSACRGSRADTIRP